MTWTRGRARVLSLSTARLRPGELPAEQFSSYTELGRAAFEMQAASQFEFATSGLDPESFDVDDGTILFAESSGRLVLLNATAASIWHGLKFGLSPEEIFSELTWPPKTTPPIEGEFQWR